MKHGLQKALLEQLDALTPLERKISRDLFGLNGRRQKPMQELAAELGMDKTALAEELTRILRKLRGFSASDDAPPRSLFRRIARIAEKIGSLTAHSAFPRMDASSPRN